MHKTVLYLESLNTDNLDKTILIYPVNQILQKYIVSLFFNLRIKFVNNTFKPQY